MDGAGKAKHLTPERIAKIDGLAKKGVGIVYLHQVIDTPKANADAVQAWVGGVWIPGGARGHWDGVFEKFPEHPTTRGVKPFTENDGFIYKNRLSEGIVPLLRASPPKGPALKGNEDVVAWAFERPSGGRSFVFTGCHLHESWGHEGMRRFVINGILWSAGLEVPKDGAPVELDPAELKKNLDPKPTGAK
jgi:type 1 glutamine amidotransferase